MHDSEVHRVRVTRAELPTRIMAVRESSVKQLSRSQRLLQGGVSRDLLPNEIHHSRFETSNEVLPGVQIAERSLQRAQDFQECFSVGMHITFLARPTTSAFMGPSSRRSWSEKAAKDAHSSPDTWHSLTK